MTRKTMLSGIAAISVAAVAMAQSAGKQATPPGSTSAIPAAEPHFMKQPSELSWKDGPPSLPPGAKMVPLEGDLSKEAFFAIRLKLPAGYKIPPHFHPVFERITVIEGTFQLGHGEKWDAASMKDWPSGSYISMSPGMRHFAGAKTDTIIQLASVGPWGITYINPADDPRNKKTTTK